ncbi:unnamed protein product [Rotaria magnacalcarata]|uniref:Uncharacterized protein n=1 Tax=Rotaria magnacalcarata TaxID=392030 RepID=A0A819WKJ6_9BILA|nr:unnamed protein product [Rotaria magnacalcarata]
MFNLDSTSLHDTSLFGQSTPVNLHRTESSFLFGNTSTTPFLSSNLRGTTNIPKTSPLETTTFHKYVSTGGLDKANKNPTQTSYHTKLSNDFGSDTLKDNQKHSSAIIPTSTPTTSSRLTSFLFDNKSSTKPITAVSLGISQPSTSTFTPGTSSFLPLTTAANFSFNFSLSKNPVITSSTSITPAPVLFSTMNQATTSSVDLQSFRTMLNTQPFDNESAFLARHTKN